MNVPKVILLFAVAAVSAVAALTLGPSNVDPAHKFSWNENQGWMNWRDATAGAEGVLVGTGFLSGSIWGENTGWINVGDGAGPYANTNGLDFGVNILPGGDLDGFAWSENRGWINFGWAASTANPNRARFDSGAGRFFGFAWSENDGWINLDDDIHYVGATVEEELGAPLAATYPHDRRKNRYISFDPNKAENDGTNVAFKVELLSLNMGSCDDGTGAQAGNVDFCRVDRGAADCKACSGSGDSCISASIDCSPGESCDPTGAVCVNDLPNSGGSNVGIIWWVGPEKDTAGDPNLNIHLLVSEPFRKVSTDWPNPTHAGDCEVVPQASYGVRAVDTAGGAESSELVVETTQFPPLAPPAPFWWGDVVGVLAFHCNADIREATCVDSGDCGGDPCERAWELPNGVTNLDDVTAALWTSAPAPPTTVSADSTWVDVHGNDSFTPGSQNFDPPNNKINASDLQQIISGFGGAPYKFYDPTDCPDVDEWL